MANELVYTQSASSDAYAQWDGLDLQGVVGIGNQDAAKNISGAMRFAGVQVVQSGSIYSAILKVYSEFHGGGTIRFSAYGIKEGNTAAFSSNPFGRTKTSSVVNSSSSPPGTGSYLNIDVKTIVQEIIGQGTWTAGNAMGFLVLNNGSDDPGYMEDDGLHCQLIIQTEAPPDFTPDPSTIGTPTFPTAQNYGLRVSQPGIDVKTASESELMFTTRKKVIKIASEGEATTSTGIYHIGHSLGYIPGVMGFMESGDKRYKLNKYSGTPSGFIGATGTSIIIYSAQGTSIYYYSFVDPLT